MDITPSSSISAISLLCPVFVPPVSESRENLSLVTNETPSHVPSLFYDPDKTGPCSESVHILVAKVLPTLNLENNLDLIVRLKEDISDHVENRMQLFYLQLLMVFKTNLKLSYSTKALHQAGFLSKKKSPIELAEAHSSTLPCLLTTKHGIKRVLGEGSSFYNANNMTVKVAKPVNAFDTWIDTATKEFEGSSLRDRACLILQDASLSKIDPKKGFQDFIKRLLIHAENYKTTHPNPIPQLISKYYIKTIKHYKTGLEKDDKLIKALSFEHGSTHPVNEAFFLNIQKQIHLLFRNEMKIQLQRQKLFLHKPLSKTQDAYAKIYLASPRFTTCLRQYFTDTDLDQLKIDWKKIAQTSSTRETSEDLTEIMDTGTALIEKAYGITSVKSTEKIFASMLYQASVTLDEPDVTALYTLPAVAPAKIRTPKVHHKHGSIGA